MHSQVKKSSRLNQERNMHRSSTVYKQKKPSKQMSVDFDVRRQKEMYFFTGGRVMMNYGLLMMDLFLPNKQIFTSQDVNWEIGVVWITCGLLWGFYQLFGLWFWRHPFTADDPLMSKGTIPLVNTVGALMYIINIARY